MTGEEMQRGKAESTEGRERTPHICVLQQSHRQGQAGLQYASHCAAHTALSMF